MDGTLTYKCPNCDAGLLFNADTQKFSCEFCLSSFTEEELLEAGCDAKAEETAKADEEFRENVRQYYCTNCGAEVIADLNTVADFCYYCHNPVVLSDKVSGVFKPSKVIPFKLSKEDACQSFLSYARKKIFAPKNYFSKEQIEKMRGVYYPFWVTDADTDSEFRARGKKVRSWRSGDYRYTETSIYNVYRRGRIHFEDITTSAISTEDKAMLEGILPYPIEEYKDFSMPYLQGFLAKKRDIERDGITGEVKGRMNGYAETLLRRTAVGYTSLDVHSADVAVLSSHWEYSLLPIWIMTYKKKNRKGKERTFVYAMNGATGKVYGEFPVSIPKLILFGLGVFIGAAALLGLIGALAIL